MYWNLLLSAILLFLVLLQIIGLFRPLHWLGHLVLRVHLNAATQRVTLKNLILLVLVVVCLLHVALFLVLKCSN